MKTLLGILLALSLVIPASATAPNLLDSYVTSIAGRGVKISCPHNWAEVMGGFGQLDSKEIYGLTDKLHRHIYINPANCNLNSPTGLLAFTHEAFHVRFPKYTESQVEACALEKLKKDGRLTKAIMRVHMTLPFYYWLGTCSPQSEQPWFRQPYYEHHDK